MPLFGPPNVEKMEKKRDVEGLIKVLLDDKVDLRIRCAAVESLGRVGDRRATEALTPLLLESLFSWTGLALSKSAAAALDNLGWVPGKNETAARYWIVKEEFDMCVEIGLAAVAPLAEAISFHRSRREFLELGKAKEALSKIPDIKAREPLLSLVAEADNGDVRSAAANALANVADEHAVDALIRRIQTNPANQLWCVYALGKIRDPRAVEPLLNIVNDEKLEAEVREKAVQALGAIGDKKAVEPLVKAMLALYAHALPGTIGMYTRKELAEECEKALSALGWQVGKGQASAEYWIARADWSKCIEIADPALEPLARFIESEKTGESSSQTQQVAAMGALRRIYESGNRQTRVHAVEAFEKLETEEAISFLISALQDEDELVRAAAASGLGGADIGFKDTVLALTRASSDKSDQVRKNSASALDRLKTKLVTRAVLDPEGFDPKTHMHGGLAMKAKTAIMALIIIGDFDDSVVRFLTAKVHDLITKCKSENVLLLDRDEKTLWQLYGGWISAAESFLTRCSKVPETSKPLPERDEAAVALSESPADQSMQAMLDGLRESLGKPVKTSLRFVASDVDDYVADRHDPHSVERSNAREVAKKMASRCAENKDIPTLIALFYLPDYQVRWAAVDAAAAVGEAAVEALVALSQDRNAPRIFAVRALRKIGGKRAIDALAAAMKDTSSEIREEAGEAWSDMCSLGQAMTGGGA